MTTGDASLWLPRPEHNKNRRGKMRIAREIMAHWGPSATDVALSADLIPRRDYAGLNVQDDQLRIWLPDPAKIALVEICNRLGMSFTVYLTELFATYLYGVHEVMRMRDQQTGLYDTDELQLLNTETYESSQSTDDSPAFDEPVPEMGKNIFALKIFLPAKLKFDLQHRADKANTPLGKFARAMICAHLFGRDVGPNFLLATNP
ncbi:MAG: hypothetical protein K9K38_01700 [Rhodoferax sp.]|nr:hypothetical protein [Rhodoferax sp.]